jgi:selenide,water dikinase
VRACTDVTGFGLAGHLLEMLDASHVSARLLVNKVPIYAGFDEVVSQGIVSTLHGDNAKVSCRVQCASPPAAWLFDPQTSGGLLAAVKPGSVARTLQQLKDSGYSDAAMIGEVVPVGPGEAPAIML